MWTAWKPPSPSGCSRNASSSMPTTGRRPSASCSAIARFRMRREERSSGLPCCSRSATTTPVPSGPAGPDGGGIEDGAHVGQPVEEARVGIGVHLPVETERKGGEAVSGFGGAGKKELAAGEPEVVGPERPDAAIGRVGHGAGGCITCGAAAARAPRWFRSPGRSRSGRSRWRTPSDPPPAGCRCSRR